MYVYLYDNFLRKGKYEALVKSMENRLTDFGIAGKIIRLQNLTNAQEIVEDEVRKGAETVVIVGDDTTFGHVLSRAASAETVFGFLPVGPDNAIAEILGIPSGEEACEVLSRRRKIKLDVGWVNNRYFVSRLTVEPAEISVVYDEKFKVFSEPGKKLELVVCNLMPYVENEKREKIIIHPQDGKLEAFLRPVARKSLFKTVYEEASVFPFEEMVVSGNRAFTVEADGKKSKETKIKIKLAKKKVEMVVGKDRQF
ncbi:MAG TPA: diacylglycerol kinase family protein [Candidatus Magasanikbacteria bacterium]|nr:diacylglycerol kinase family protein [Candidatus Magasanikbacteria bacterium]